MTYTTKVYKSDNGDTLNIDQTNGGALKVNGNDIADDLAALNGLAAELALLDGVTAGTVAASKVVIVDSNKDAGDFRNLDAVNIDAGASGTAGSVDVFPATASKGKLAITCENQTGNTTVTLKPATMGQATVVTIPDPGAAASYVAQSTAALTLAEVDVLDGATAGTAVASKALVVDASIDIAGLRNVTATGTVKATGLTFEAGATDITFTVSGANVIVANLPTADPTVAGALWNDTGTLKISTGGG